MEIEDNVKQCLLSRGFTKKQLLNNRGLIGATIDETVKLLTKPAVIKSVCECLDYNPPLLARDIYLCEKCGKERYY